MSGAQLLENSGDGTACMGSPARMAWSSMKVSSMKVSSGVSFSGASSSAASSSS
eukprot:CAMPEP_0171119874 /NCGR_PEP_ID=MMETSP0766_2-20121228/98266_1 /TAXON_ID=439317 /ORGANISM="Gambierdiscus australes, Strain CAWD 149" /LENGTH=53 /DNA_ID=CAMNT_0011582567 /DNA_START=111 /DNA_END=269 /DNA_ORIENTATION=+